MLRLTGVQVENMHGELNSFNVFSLSPVYDLFDSSHRFWLSCFEHFPLAIDHY